MYKKFVLLGVFATTFSPIGTVYAETLQQTMQNALNSHPSLQGASASKEVASQVKAEAQSGFYPVVNAATSAGYIYADNSTSRGLTVSRGSGSSALFEGNVSLVQPLYNGGQKKNRVNAADARIQAADFTMADRRETIALQAVQAHIGVLQAQEVLNKTKSYINTIEDYLERIQFMVDEGVADETEVTQAQNISLQLKSALLDSQGQFQSALANYNEVVGRVPQSALVKPNYVSTIPTNIEAAISQAKSSHPLVLSNIKEMEALGFEVAAEKATLHPDVNAELSGIRREQKEVIGGELTDARAVLSLNWDFETGGASKARQKQSLAQYAELKAQNEEQMRVIEGDIRRAYAELETAQNQVTLVRQREKVTQDLFNAYKTQFEGAVVRLLQIMQAENQVYNAQLESITVEYRYLFAQYAVLASVGQLRQILNGANGAPQMPLAEMPMATSTAKTPSASRVISAPIPVDRQVPRGPVSYGTAIAESDREQVAIQLQPEIQTKSMGTARLGRTQEQTSYFNRSNSSAGYPSTSYSGDSYPSARYQGGRYSDSKAVQYVPMDDEHVVIDIQ